MQPLDPHERELWVGLREYFDAVLEERQARLDERWVAQEQAIGKATSSLEARLELLNELRSDVLTRNEYDSKHELLTNGPHEQVTDGVLVFRRPDDPYDVADPANPTNWRLLP